jgi:hypothetical protein
MSSNIHLLHHQVNLQDEDEQAANNTLKLARDARPDNTNNNYRTIAAEFIRFCEKSNYEDGAAVTGNQ